jgi:hypothetical protein
MGRKTAFGGGGSEDETMANLWEYKSETHYYSISI